MSPLLITIKLGMIEILKILLKHIKVKRLNLRDMKNKEGLDILDIAKNLQNKEMEIIIEKSMSMI
jgi:hypothetical protein